MKGINILLTIVLVAGLAVESGASPSFETVAGAVEADRQKAGQEQELTLESIAGQRDSLTRQLAGLEADLVTAEGRLNADKALLKQLSRERDDLKRDIAVRLAGKEELDTIIKDHVRCLLGRFEKSPFSAESPRRLDILNTCFAKGHSADMNDLKTLLDLCFEDMAEAGRTVRYTGMLLDRSGEEISGDIIRLGHITTMHRSQDRTGYLTLSPASGRLVMSSTPPRPARRSIGAYFDGTGDAAYIDISGGVAVEQLARRVSMADQLRSGGILVVPILLVGLVAMILTIERLIFLGRVRHNTDALMTRVTALVSRGDFKGALAATLPHKNRPTGRVLMVGLEYRDESRSVLESALSQAILRETPRLERFLGALKVSAAVAPLLGLLGTVTGMINTFQVITTHGTGDPRLMAGGISEAMVTTQVGLVVAIPIMMIAAFLGRRAHTLSQDMEEKGLALMAALLKLKTTTRS